tara:strand:- start:178 stop:690 length:513 start_codon:yes stop_codon:yes gene_type:complete
VEDNDFVLRAVNGDSRAFEWIVNKYQGIVRGMLVNLCHRNDVADDLAQHTFLSAWQKLASFNQGSLKSWLCSIAYRHFLMWKRANRNEYSTTTLSAEFHHEDNSTFRDLHKGMQQLTQIQREIVTLQSLIGLTQNEIAGILGIPLGTVKSHSTRALATLRNCLAGEIHEK